MWWLCRWRGQLRPIQACCSWLVLSWDVSATVGSLLKAAWKLGTKVPRITYLMCYVCLDQTANAATLSAIRVDKLMSVERSWVNSWSNNIRVCILAERFTLWLLIAKTCSKKVVVCLQDVESLDECGGDRTGQESMCSRTLGGSAACWVVGIGCCLWWSPWR